MPILGAAGACITSSKRYDGLGMLLMAAAAVLFDGLATLLIMLVCACAWREKRSANMTGGAGLIMVIWRESVLYWLTVLGLHSVNM